MGESFALEIRDIRKFYGSMQALSDVSLSVNKGEFVTLLGPSGSGKTTLLKILAGFETPSGGSIHLNGREITHLKPEERNFGFVFQGYALFPHMSVRDNIAYPLKIRRWSRKRIEARVKEILDLVQLNTLALRRPYQLSGGQQQRVALARALVFQPDLLLLDEPMSALDKQLRADLQVELRDIHRSLGTTFIYVTHDQEEAMNMSDRIAVMDHGVIEQYDTPHALYRHPASISVARFVGRSNIFSGVIEPRANDSLFQLRNGAGIALRVPTTGLRGDVSLMVRPEDMTIMRSPSNGDENALQATIIDSTYFGDRMVYSLQVPEHGTITAYGRAHADQETAAIGERVWVTFASTDCIVIG